MQLSKKSYNSNALYYHGEEKNFISAIDVIVKDLYIKFFTLFI
jgi:hypothetical protein